MTKIKFAAMALLSAIACNSDKPTEPSTRDSTAITKAIKAASTEIGDPKFVEIGKKELEKLSSGDIDGWIAAFADNCVFRWSAGDSLIGKAAIYSYWKNRRFNVMDSIRFFNDIWYSLKVNVSQRGPDVPGNWLLSWTMVNIKYKTGNKLIFWEHKVFHFNASDKIDIVVSYVDKAPINKALQIQ